MTTRLQPINLVDFTGGLNLRRSDFNLAENESPAMTNVEIDPRRGFSSRRGWVRWNATDIVTPANWHPRNGYLHEMSDGTYLIYVTNGTTIWAANTGGSFDDQSIAVSADPHLADFGSWGDIIYIACGMNETSYKRDGTGTPAAMGDAASGFNDDYTIPAGGKMPRCRFVEPHVGYLFTAATKEGGVEYPNRVRWSHPNQPEDWATLDYIDIEIGGGRITGLLSFQDHILIFKTGSVWALYGYNSESWQLVQVSRSAGAPTCTCITASESAVYFYSAVGRNGIYAYTGGQVVHISEKLRTAMEEIDEPNEVWVSWMGRRLWTSFPWLPDDRRTGDETSAFVFDPEVGEGAWVRHESALGSITVLIPRSDTATDYPMAAICGHSGAACLARLDFQDRAEDKILEDGTSTAFDASYRTGWFDAGYPERLKSWRRPRFIFRNPANDVIVSVKGYWNYSVDTPVRTYNVALLGPEDVTTWDDFDWDDGSLWVAETTGSRIDRGLPFGHSRALQLEFSVSPITLGAAWGVDAVVLKYLYRRFTT